MTAKPDAAEVLRSTACETSVPASPHDRPIWLVESAVAVRFDGAVTMALVGRRRPPSPLDRQAAIPSRRHAPSICVRHCRLAPPAATQAAMSSWQFSRQMRASDVA